MLPEKKHHLESEWAVIVSQHLLSKLTVNNKYLVDSYRMENCPCNDGDDLIVSMGDTSYGMYAKVPCSSLCKTQFPVFHAVPCVPKVPCVKRRLSKRPKIDFQRPTIANRVSTSSGNHGKL